MAAQPQTKGKSLGFGHELQILPSIRVPLPLVVYESTFRLKLNAMLGVAVVIGNVRESSAPNYSERQKTREQLI